MVEYCTELTFESEVETNRLEAEVHPLHTPSLSSRNSEDLRLETTTLNYARPPKVDRSIKDVISFTDIKDKNVDRSFLFHRG